MADWFIATEGVKVVKDSATLAPQIITAVASIGAALGAVSLTHHYTRKREERAATAKMESERLYICTELVFLLEQFAEGCARIATDTGHTDAQGYTRSNEITPDLDLSVVSGDWRVLPPRLMYTIREIPIMQKVADRLILATEEHDHVPEYFRTFHERQYQYSRLGLRAIIQARRLRKNAGFPATRLDATEWSAQPLLWNVWRLERNRRSVQARLRLQTIAQMNVALQQNIQSNSLPGGTQ